MDIIDFPPPNYDEILKVFPMAEKPGVIFTYGNTIYNPSGVEISGPLRAHEAVHGQRQGKSEGEIQAWWKRYLEEPMFRLEEELLAHRAEYRDFKGREKDPRKVAWHLDHVIAARLACPLYGSVISQARARRLIVVEVDKKKLDKMRRETMAQGATA